MTISHLLAPIPKWVIMNDQGEAAGGAKMYTYRSLNKVQQKPVYQDPAGTIPWTNPIIFDANGTQGPFYWTVDSAALNDTYYLEVYDSDDVLLFTIDNYFPPGSGGGGSTTTYVPLNNFIANNVFIDHVDDITTTSVNDIICPSNHHGFTPSFLNPVIGTNGAVGGDIRFVKNNLNATDTITFVPFVLGANPLTGDVTPVDYIRYQCTNSPVGETYKSFQFPINQKVANLDNQDMTFTIWARVGVTPVNITLYTRQYFGSGGAPSAEVRASQGTLALTTTWTKFNLSVTVPGVGGKTLGSCGDDALYLQLEMPLGAPCDVWFTKPSFFLGTLDPTIDFDTYDEIDSVTQTPRTGDVKTSFLPGVPRGWMSMNNKSIGSATSGATGRANIDTFPLFKTLWDGVSNTYAPVSTGRGASAVADFNANKNLTLVSMLGRVMMGVNPDFTQSLTFTAVAVTDIITVSSTTQLPTGTPLLVSNAGGALPTPLVANTPYYVINLGATTLKLAHSADLAAAGTPIDLTTDGSGTNTLLTSLGVTTGEGLHALISSELPDPITTTAGTANVGAGGIAVITSGVGVGFGTVTNSGGNNGHNTMQPTSFTNVIIKL